MAATLVTAQEASRITSHMNGEHGSSLAHYLEHYGRVKAPINPKITNFSTPSMTIDHGPANRRKSWTMKFEPPMLAGQARKRLEQMHQDARAGLGLSEATIDHFSLGFGDKVTLLISILIWVALLVSPPSLLLSYIPWAANHVRTIISYLGIASSEDRVGHGIKLLLLGPLALIHTAEVFACLFPLMYRFNTSTSSVRTKYIVATVVGGFPVWKRLRHLGEREEFKLKQKSH